MIERLKLLKWQRELLKHFAATGYKKDYVLVAGTGTGKTRGGMACALQCLGDFPDAKIFIVTPSRQTKRGWVDVLKLSSVFYASEPSEVSSDRRVFLSTYAGAPTMLAALSDTSGGQRLILVFDEFHHLEMTGEWAAPFIDMPQDGNGLRYVKRIFLSATPWHESGGLSMVDYDDNDEVKADFTYTYGHNVNDKDDRNTVAVAFHGVDGTVHIDREDNATGTVTREVRHTNKTARSDSISDFVRFEDFDALQSENAKHVRVMLDRGVKSLTAKRARVPDIGGIVFASGRKEAMAVCRYLLEVHGIEAVFVMADDAQAHNKIDAFRRNKQEWLVAVDMVAEGCDIPRLKVAVDLSWKLTLLAIIQRIGRIVRLLRGSSAHENMNADYFHLTHKQLVYVAERIEAELACARKNPEPGVRPPAPTSTKTVVDSEADLAQTYWKGVPIEAFTADLAGWLLSTDYGNLGIADFQSAVPVAKHMIQTNTVPSGYTPPQSQETANFKPYHMGAEMERLSRARKGIKACSTELAQNYFDSDYKACGLYINKRYGTPSWSQSNKTLAETEERWEFLKALLLEFRSAKKAA